MLRRTPRYLRVPHPSRFVRRVGSYAPTPPVFFYLGFLHPSPPSTQTCHPDRSGPIFCSTPNCGGSGRVARLVRPVRFAGVEGSAFSALLCDLGVLPSVNSVLPALFSFIFVLNFRLSTLNAGYPRHGVCAWVLGYLPLRFWVPQVRFFTWVLGFSFLGLPSLVLSSRPERRRLLPLRSGGICFFRSSLRTLCPLRPLRKSFPSF